MHICTHKYIFFYSLYLSSCLSFLHFFFCLYSHFFLFTFFCLSHFMLYYHVDLLLWIYSSHIFLFHLKFVQFPFDTLKALHSLFLFSFSQVPTIQSLLKFPFDNFKIIVEMFSYKCFLYYISFWYLKHFFWHFHFFFFF